MVKDKNSILKDKKVEFSIDDLGFNVDMLEETLDDIDSSYKEFNSKLAKSIISYDDTTIEEYVRDWTYYKIGKDFTFREYQLEAIIRIIKNILDHKYQNYIIEAPTGSGKSLINMIAAGTLADYFNITSYI